MTNMKIQLRPRTPMSATALIIAAAAFALSAPAARAYTVAVDAQVFPLNIGEPNVYSHYASETDAATSISLDSGVVTGAYFLELSGHVTGSANLATGILSVSGQGNTTLRVVPTIQEFLTFHVPSGRTSSIVRFSLQVKGSYNNLAELAGNAGITLGGVSVIGDSGTVPDFLNQTLSGQITVTDGESESFGASLGVSAINFGSVPVSFQTNPSARITLQLEPGVSFTSQSGVFLSQSSAPATYRLTDLGTLGGPGSKGNAINDSGQVTGWALTSATEKHAFLWSGSSMQDLGTLGGPESEGTAINSSGQVTGQAELADSYYAGQLIHHAFLWNGTALQDLGTLAAGVHSAGVAINASGQVTGRSFGLYAGVALAQRAFLWDGTTMRDLGAMGGAVSDGSAINDAGQVTGTADTDLYSTSGHAFRWDGTAMRDVGTLGGTQSLGRAINDSGQVTGWAYTTGETQHAFRWDGATVQDLATLGGTTSDGLAINASGHVTGWASTTGDAAEHAFLWDGTTMRDLDTPGGLGSHGQAINDSGEVTGYAYISGSQRAFLWDGAALQNLNALIDPADPLQPYVTLSEGRDINAGGQIIANGCDSRTFECHAYLVSPVTTTDPTAPSITPNVTGTQGANGWYTSDVAVSWSVIDAESAISSSTGCDAATVTTDTIGQTLTCSATSAGGTTSQSVTIKRDTAAPTASATPAPMPNPDGWNKADVTVTFAGTDPAPGSGIANCTPAAVLSTEGLHSGVQGHCSDLAGFDSNNAVAPDIRIDKTAPTVTGSRTPAPNGADWNRTTVTVEFSATDNLSGVPAGGCDSPTYLSSDGPGQSVTGQCHDLAGNVDSATVSGIDIDTTPPIAAANVSPGPNVNGWNNTNVVVSFSATDSISGSGIATCSAPVTVSSEGLTSGTQGFCTDAAGNDSNNAVAPNLRIDKTAPTVIVTTPANLATYSLGATVSASFVCSDSLSALVPGSCTGPVANGSAIDTATSGSKSFTVSAADLAGNTRSTTNAYTVVTPPPSIAPVLSGTLGDNGWYRSTVSLSWQVTSPYSAITSTSGCRSVSVSKDTAGTTYTCSATNAGGTSSKSVTVKRDATAPAITITTPKNKASYTRGSTVASSYTCSDATAGIATTQGCVGTVPNGAAIDTASTGSKAFSVNAKDQAGNTASKAVSYSVK